MTKNALVVVAVAAIIFAGFSLAMHHHYIWAARALIDAMPEATRPGLIAAVADVDRWSQNGCACAGFGVGVGVALWVRRPRGARTS